MSTQQPVVVTGASGFVGSHIVVKLLDSGYSVRLLARGAKAKLLQESVVKNNEKAELVEITDIATDDLSTAFQGAGAIIHVASPLAGRADPETSLAGALEGTLNVLRQAVAHKVKKVVLTGSSGSCRDINDPLQSWAGKVYTEKDWGQVTSEEVLDGTRNIMWIYGASKILAEQAAWKFAEEHRELDLTCINPPFIYGPFAKGFPIPDPSEIGANGLLYQLIKGEKAHVLALDVPPVHDIQSKRILVSGGYFLWKDAVEVLVKTRPDLADRLPSVETASRLPGPISTIDNSRAKAVLGLDKYVGWEQTVIDTLDDLLVAERGWASAA